MDAKYMARRLNENMIAINNKINVNKNELQAAQQQLQTLVMEKDVLETTVKGLKSKTAKEDANKRIDEIDGELDRMKKLVADLTKDRNELNNEYHAINEDIDNLRKGRL
jgi:chromosome segregation ATPase